LRKGLATAYLLACALLAACSPAAAPDAQSTPTPRFTAAPVDVSVLVPEVERAALTSRDRVVRTATDLERWDAVPVAAGEAAALLEQLVTAERAIRDPSVKGQELAYMGHLQQLVYLRLIERGDIRDAVFDGIPKDLRPAADLNIAAGSDMWLYGPAGVRELPEWRIVSAAPMADLLRYYREAEAEFGVPWYYLAAINLVETRMGRIRGDSYAGAQGPMQFMPATWDMYGDGDINDTHDAILAAGRYLSAAGAPKKIERAIWMYNHDNEYVDAVMKYAEVMRSDPSAYRGYYGWQVYFVTRDGTYLLPEGWSKT
jgi:soluble lytic murein transglycosylase-like protein